MANWLYIIDIKHLTDTVNDEDPESLKQFCQGTVKVLNEFIEKARKNVLISHEYWEDVKEELGTIRDEFELLMVDSSVTRDEVNDKLDDLYNWGDSGVCDELMHKEFGRLAWINHMFDYSGNKLDKMQVRNGFVFSHIKTEA